MISEAVPAAPLVPAAGLGLAALALVLSYLVAMGLLNAWGATIGRAMVWLAGKLRRIGFSVLGKHIGLGFLADVVMSVDNQIKHWLGAWALASAHGFTWCLNSASWLIRETLTQVEGIARDLYHVAVAATVTLPEKIIEKAIRLAGHATHAALATLRRIIARDIAAIRHLTHRAQVRAAHALDVAEHAGAWARPRFRRDEAAIRRLGKRLDRISGKVAPIAFAGLVSAALARLGLKWLRCSKHKRFSKNVCGMDANLLESLLLDTTAIVGAISVVAMARELQEIEPQAVRLIRGFVRELP